jgi:hypothetical protein
MRRGEYNSPSGCITEKHLFFRFKLRICVKLLDLLGNRPKDRYCPTGVS